MYSTNNNCSVIIRTEILFLYWYKISILVFTKSRTSVLDTGLDELEASLLAEIKSALNLTSGIILKSNKLFLFASVLRTNFATQYKSVLFLRHEFLLFNFFWQEGLLMSFWEFHLRSLQLEIWDGRSHCLILPGMMCTLQIHHVTCVHKSHARKTSPVKTAYILMYLYLTAYKMQSKYNICNSRAHNHILLYLSP